MEAFSWIFKWRRWDGFFHFELDSWRLEPKENLKWHVRVEIHSHWWIYGLSFLKMGFPKSSMPLLEWVCFSLFLSLLLFPSFLPLFFLFLFLPFFFPFLLLLVMGSSASTPERGVSALFLLVFSFLETCPCVGLSSSWFFFLLNPSQSSFHGAHVRGSFFSFCTNMPPFCIFTNMSYLCETLELMVFFFFSQIHHNLLSMMLMLVFFFTNISYLWVTSKVFILGLKKK